MDTFAFLISAVLAMVIIYALYSHTKSTSSTTEPFVITGPWPGKQTIVANDDHGKLVSDETCYANRREAYLPEGYPEGLPRSPPYSLIKSDTDTKEEISAMPSIKSDRAEKGISQIKARSETAPVGHPYRRQEHVGYRWKESWRPYFWKNYPEPPIWFPSRSPSGDAEAMPPDDMMLRMMENSKNTGISPQGDQYFWRLQQPYQALCAKFADSSCRNQNYPYFCFRRSYGKCLQGAL